jgi:hypothetical protein
VTVDDYGDDDNRPDIVMLCMTMKAAYLIDVSIPNGHNLYSTVTKKLQKYTDLKEELTRIYQMNAVCVVPLLLTTMGIIPNKLYDTLNQLNLCPDLYTVMQKTVILNTCHTL